MKLHHIGVSAGHESPPLYHQLASAFEYVASEIGSFNTAHSVRERCLCELTWLARVRTPISETRPEIMHHSLLGEAGRSQDLGE